MSMEQISGGNGNYKKIEGAALAGVDVEYLDNPEDIAAALREMNKVRDEELKDEVDQIKEQTLQ